MESTSKHVQALVNEMHGRLMVVPPNHSLIAAHTKMRDAEASQSSFVLHADRVIRQLLEHAVSALEYKSKTVYTPTGNEFVGCELAKSVCGVSILRAGESMERSLRAIVRNAVIGKVLIQRDETTPHKRANLFYSKLPRDIAQMQIILLDPMLATGGSACCALDRLIEAGVPEECIVFATIVSCEEGIRRVLEKFSAVRIVTTAIDPHLNNDKYIVPGLGDFGDRYYGTTTH